MMKALTRNRRQNNLLLPASLGCPSWSLLLGWLSSSLLMASLCSGEVLAKEAKEFLCDLLLFLAALGSLFHCFSRCPNQVDFLKEFVFQSAPKFVLVTLALFGLVGENSFNGLGPEIVDQNNSADGLVHEIVDKNSSADGLGLK